eukprot:44605-Eustigmatos_ZCMA.PRE.1
MLLVALSPVGLRRLLGFWPQLAGNLCRRRSSCARHATADVKIPPLVSARDRRGHMCKCLLEVPPTDRELTEIYCCAITAMTAGQECG